MALDRTTNKFEDPYDAERWFSQLRQQWVVTGTTVETDPESGATVATAEFATKGGAVVRATREET